MYSITFTTDAGTVLEVRSIDSHAVVDIVAAAALAIESAEEVLEAGGDLDGRVILSPMPGGAVLGLSYPEAEDALEPGDEYAVGLSDAAETPAVPAPAEYTPENPPEGYFWCEGCEVFHNNDVSVPDFGELD